MSRSQNEYDFSRCLQDFIDLMPSFCILSDYLYGTKRGNLYKNDNISWMHPLLKASDTELSLWRQSNKNANLMPLR
jgi:hypothetical protein